MKKMLPILVLAAGAAAYFITKNKKVQNDEVKIIKLDDNNEEEIEDSKSDEENEEESTKVEIPAEVTAINMKYPYLKARFIMETLDYAKNFNTEYPDGTLVRISHVAKFALVENLIQFVQVIKENDYSVQEADQENTILAMNDCLVTGDSIINDVFEVANQVYCLEGEYFGFQIDKI